MMPNIIAVIISAVVNMAIGFVWYGPLFSKPWMKYNKVDADKMKEANKHMAKLYTPMMIGSLVTAFVLGWFIKTVGMQSLTGGLTIGFLAWLGFTGTSQLASWIFSGKKIQAYYIDTGYWLVSYVLMGAVLGMWK